MPHDTLLLFRLGDFYELFFDDAKEASGLLNLALTHRNSVPMCGMPYHAAQGYIAKLIQAGRRVAVCDQTSEPQPGKIVTREITQIITAGTVSELDCEGGGWGIVIALVPRASVKSLMLTVKLAVFDCAEFVPLTCTV